jgi:hypothetical protein
MKKLLTVLLVLILSVASYAEENWTIDDSNWIYANGNTVHGHKFGFVKDKGDKCDENLLFISWSTYSSGLEKFKGQDVKVFMDFDGEVTHTTLVLVSTYNFADISTWAMFSNVVMPEEFLDIIRKSKSLVVAFSTKNEMTKTLDIQNDTFDIEGFSEKFQQAQNQCKNIK